MTASSATLPGDQQLLPDRGPRLAPWLIGVLMFVTVLVGAAGLALANAARLVASGAEQRWSIQLPGGARTAEPLAAKLRTAKGVEAATALPEAEVRSLVGQWLGPDLAASADLPLPGLIDLTLAPGASPAPLRQALAQTAPSARLTSYPEQLGPLLSSLRFLGGIALALVLLMAAASAAAVMLATRSAYDAHRGTIEVLHGIGATDRQLAALFQRRMTREALIGGISGTILGLTLIFLTLVTSGAFFTLAANGPALRPLDIVVLGLLPLAGALLARLVARATIHRALRATL
ncbi:MULTISPECIES: FtsX-like permease family protein [Sphingomonas]|uniref:FtsX-like permease family protein n=1 Tax=Sphingomonas TaxID=13687 RepID=UPI000DEEF46C|nr:MULTISPECIES: FtsX-like permease family protein [Sphingomonas]